MLTLDACLSSVQVEVAQNGGAELVGVAPVSEKGNPRRGRFGLSPSDSLHHEDEEEETHRMPLMVVAGGD